MADDSSLNGPNDEANANPTTAKVETQKIKSGDEPVNGIHLGDIDNVPLLSEDDAQNIDNAVDRALQFRPTAGRTSAILSAAARIRQDTGIITPYVTARNAVVGQIQKAMSNRGGRISAHAAEQIQTINAIIMERTIGTRLDDANKVRESQLNTSRNILKFHTTTMTTFMKHSLALQYRHLFATKDLLTMTKAFADMAENKLDAIKINTSLPEVKKNSLLDVVKEQLRKKALNFAGKHIIDILSHETIEDARAHIQGLKSQATSLFKRATNFKMAATGKDPSKPDDGMPAKPAMQRVREALAPDAIWATTAIPRKLVIDQIKHLSGEKKKPEKLLTDILTKLSKQLETQQTLAPGMVPPSSPEPTPIMDTLKAQPSATNVIADSLLSMGKTLETFHGSFDNFKDIYEKTSTKHYDILASIDKTLVESPGMTMNGNSAETPTQPVGTSIFSKFQIFNKFSKKTYVFADVYRKDSVTPGQPLVSREQLVNKKVVRADGKPIRSLNDLNVPILDVDTGNVVISNDDLTVGLVDVHNKAFASITTQKKRGIVGGVGSIIGNTLGVYGSLLGFQAKLIRGAGNFLFKSRDKSPYADVYLAGNIKPGRPLVSAKKFREGLVFANGSRVLNVNEINQPVIDPKTGQTIITEEDLKIGLVDVYGNAISKRKASFSTLGGLFDLSKFGIKTAGSLATPVIGMYAEMFKMLPKVMFGVGSFVSKSIVGILSGKAPGILAKGLMGVAGSITKMYGQVFGLGIKGIGGIFGKLFGGGKKGSPLGNMSKKDIYDLISVRLDHIYNLLDVRLANNNIREGSYQDHENRLKKDRENLVHLEEETPTGKSKSVFSRLAAVLGMGGAAAASDEASDDSDPDKKSDSGGIIDDVKSAAEYGIGAKIASKIPGVGFVKRIIPGKKAIKNLAGFAGKGIGKIAGMAGLGGLGKFASKGLDTVVKDGAAMAEEASALGPEAEKLIDEAASKSGVKNAVEGVVKAGSKLSLKDIIKLGGKSLIKKIPGIGAIAGLGFAADDAYHGDYTAATGDAASGLVSLLPFVGTSASVAIDGWMAYNAAHKATGNKLSNLTKARLKVYGATSEQADLIDKLEQRVMVSVIAKGGHKIMLGEAQSFAKEFGFDVTNKSQFQYFCDWFDNRFCNAYLTFVSVLRRHNYDVTKNASDVREKDMDMITTQFLNDTSTLVTKYVKLIPSMAGYKNSPQGKAEAQNTSPATATPFQDNTTPVNQNTPAQPNNLPITQAAYMVPGTRNQATPPIQSYNRPNGVVNNGLAQTAELTYTPRAANQNTQGFTSFNNAPVPGALAPGGTRRSITSQMADARNGYVRTVNSAPAQPISNAQTQQRAVQAVNYFMSQGWTAAQASGIVGSLIRESRLNTTAVGDGGAATGIAQWHGDRAGPMLQALYPGKSMADLTFEQQLAGVQWELNGPEKRAASMLKSATDPQTAGAYASKYYERPANTQGEMSVRAGLAASVFASYSKDPNSAKQTVQMASNAPSGSQDNTGPSSQPDQAPASQTAQVPQAQPSTAPQVQTAAYMPAPSSLPTPANVQTAAYMPVPQRQPVSGLGYQPVPGQYPGYSGGPGSNITNPIRAALNVAETVQDGVAAITQRRNNEQFSPKLTVQANMPQEMIDATARQVAAASQSLEALGGIHNTMKNVLGHLQQVHGPDGVFSTIADNTANSGQNQGNVFAPMINAAPPQKDSCQDNVGFSVKKKRDARYSV